MASPIFYGLSMRTRKDGIRFLAVVHESRPAAESYSEDGQTRWAALIPEANGAVVRYAARIERFGTEDEALAWARARAIELGWTLSRDEAAAYADKECRIRTAGRLRLDGANKTTIPPGMTVREYVASLAE